MFRSPVGSVVQRQPRVSCGVSRPDGKAAGGLLPLLGCQTVEAGEPGLEDRIRNLQSSLKTRLDNRGRKIRYSAERALFLPSAQLQWLILCFFPPLLADMLHLAPCVWGRQNCLREADLMGFENFASTKLFTGGGRRGLFQLSIDRRICEMFANRDCNVTGTVCRNSFGFQRAVASHVSRGSAPVCWQTLHVLQGGMVPFPYPYACHIFYY